MEARDDLIRARRDKLAKLVAAGVESYPYRFERTHRVADLLARFDELRQAGEQVTIAGRVAAKRVMGKASFAHVQDDSGRVQIYLRRDEINPPGVSDPETAPYSLFKTAIDLGDWIGVRGALMVTKTGERTLHVREWTLLAKCIRPLPVVKEEAETGRRYHEFSDPDERYRNRALDLVVNPDEREVFRIRARMISLMRRYLDEAGFLEVETPVLQPLYGGGSARPFTTHHNQLHKDLYLRIADELYLKRLIVGGLDRVYEISKDFRNEGVDRIHNPEFTMMECYAAFADYTFMLELVERIVSGIVGDIHGTREIRYGGGSLDFTPPWPRVRFFDALAEKTGRALIDADLSELRAVADEFGVEVPDNAGRGKLLDELFGELVEPGFDRPTFVIDYPIELSPLAKRHRHDPRLVERFEAIAGGCEIANAFSELNDPDDQRARFEEQQRLRGAGDEEAMPLDDDYLAALELGLPPTAGLGVGVDRLAMLLTNRSSIRDVILFPLLRDRDGEDER
ncbi:MAG: Lysine--tRNA ligase [Calditrichaeota bacterium]|nr:Lysine--tRNA ligase [Calditrichota bacterium]